MANDDHAARLRAKHLNPRPEAPPPPPSPHAPALRFEPIGPAIIFTLTLLVAALAVAALAVQVIDAIGSAPAPDAYDLCATRCAQVFVDPLHAPAGWGPIYATDRACVCGVPLETP